MRRYTLKPGRRDDLIALFEREFVETQEAAGMTLLGQFRDLDAPDRFVWMRGFPDMERRREALGAFYGGPVWKAHREAANDTMIDSDDVLLLRRVVLPPLYGEGQAASAARVGDRTASPPGPSGATLPMKGRESVITATVLYLAEPADADLKAWFEAEVRPAGDVLGVFETEAAANTFPALPVREGEHAFVWLARGAGPERLPAWLERRLVRPPEVMRLAPTPRSRLR
nr:NIPSNAP family protein [Caulobacter sp. 17J65-9]